MGKIDIEPTELCSTHVKTYVEPSVFNAIKRYQKRYGVYSVSAVVRDLIIIALEDEYPQI